MNTCPPSTGSTVLRLPLPLGPLEDPCHPSYPPALKDGWARHSSHVGHERWRSTRQPAGGKVEAKIEDGGLCPHEWLEGEILSNALTFVTKLRSAKPPSAAAQPSRMSIVASVSKYQALRTPENSGPLRKRGWRGWTAIVGSTMQKLKDLGVDDNTIVVFTTDNGTENFSWPDGGQTPFAGGKGTALEGGFRSPALIRWPGHVPAGKVENGIISGLDWFPTFVAAAGDPNIADELLKGKQLDGTTIKCADKLQPDGQSPEGTVCAPRSSHRRHTCSSHKRLQVSVHGSTEWLDTAESRGLADFYQSATRPRHAGIPNGTGRSFSTKLVRLSFGDSCSFNRWWGNSPTRSFPPMQKARASCKR